MGHAKKSVSSMSICVSRASRVSLLWPRTSIPRESIQCRQRSRATQEVDPHCGQTDQSFCIWMQKGILFNGILQNERGTIDRISLAIALKYLLLPSTSTEIVGRSCVKSGVVGNRKDFKAPLQQAQKRRRI